jgi:hypothetical protein
MHIATLAEAIAAAPPFQPEDALFAPESWGWSLAVLSEATVHAIAQVDAISDAIAEWMAILQRANIESCEKLR